ncbi:hypothetical protein [Nocardia sp. NPDC059691]|uniref:hypothetical protein n=1 Tax=Nocardia sp. NPDC059691 TaxID=3346908 RepID=UPI00369EFD24
MPDESSNDSSEIAALAQQVETARGKLPLQLDPALLEVLSEREIAAERELAEWIRARRREQRRRAIEAELATERRDRKSSAALRRSEEADARWHRRALAARRRASSQDARLAQLYRRAEWSSRALIAVVVLGMVWAGVNVQHNLVPSGDMADPLYWLSYGIEAMISIPIITIMVAATTAARWGRELARGKVIFFEAALLGTTVALNTGPHLAAGDLGRAAEYAIAPVMVGVVIWLHAWVSARYAVLIDGAPVIDPDPRTIRLDARLTPGMQGEASSHPSLDAAVNSGRFPWETYAGVTDYREAHHDANHGAQTGHRGGADLHHAGSEASTHHAVPTEMTGARPAERPDEFDSAAPTMPVPARVDPAKSATNGHAVGSRINGHPITVDRVASTAATPGNGEVREGFSTSGLADTRTANGHAVDTGMNGVAFPHTTNGHAVEPTVNGHTRGDLSVNGHVLPIDGKASRTPINGNGHPRINGHTLRPATNGHTVPTPAEGTERHPRVNGKPFRPGTDDDTTEFPATGDVRVNGHDTVPTANGHDAGTPTGINAHALPVDRHTAPASEDHTDTVAPHGSPVPSATNSRELTTSPTHPDSSAAQHVSQVQSDGRSTRSADPEAAQPSPADFEHGTPSRVRTRASDIGEPRPEPAQPAQQISLDGLEFDERPSTQTNSATPPLPPAGRGERSADRVHRGDDAARRPGSTEPMHTQSPAIADTAAQVHPNATAPRAAKRGKSMSAEQNDHSADAESEQLALEETPELSPLPIAPMPILEDDDEDDEFPTEPEEADTDDDEISAIARAITDRHLSDLPIEEVREILTLADQGGSTPAIANELGVPRSAVTRVLDSAVKVHRPYATIG